MLSGIQQNTLMDNDPLAHGYYVADLLVALAVVVLMLRARRTRPELARMLLLGTLIGLVWELPVFGLSAWTNTPIIEWATPLPLPTVVFLLAHSVWDGALLTMGWLLARALTGEPAGAPRPDRPGALGTAHGPGRGVVGDPRRDLVLRRRPVVQPGDVLVSWSPGDSGHAADLAAGAAVLRGPGQAARAHRQVIKARSSTGSLGCRPRARTGSATSSPYRQPMSAHPIMVRFKHALRL